MGVGYEHAVSVPVEEVLPTMGHMNALRAMRLPDEPRVSIRVKNIDRLRIPGSFDVSVLAEGTVIAKRAFFQPTTPQECPGCSKKGIVSFDFVVPFSKAKGDVAVAINLIRDGKRRQVPLFSCGSPTVNVRLLLEDERP